MNKVNVSDLRNLQNSVLKFSLMNIKKCVEKIEVKVSNPLIFQHLVLLFDRHDFFLHWLLIKTKLLMGELSLAPSKNIYGDYDNIYSSSLFKEIIKLRKKYHYPEELTQAIFSAFIKGEVSEEDVESYEPKNINFAKLIKENHGYFNPEILIPSPILRLDIKPEIKRDREWYWMYQDGKDKGFGIYKKIADKWNDKCPNPTDEICKYCISEVNVIEQAISRYKQLLEADI